MALPRNLHVGVRRVSTRGVNALVLLVFFVYAGVQAPIWNLGAIVPLKSPSCASGIRRQWVLGVAVGAACAGADIQVQPADAISLFGIGDLPAPPDVGAPPPDATVTSSGLAYKVLKPSSCSGETCERPLAYDKVVVDYTGWQADGKMFDSSITRGQRATFGVSQVIKGWTEGLLLTPIGEKRRFWIPAALAYGENAGFMKPGGPLVFDVEIYEIQRGPKPPAVPQDVAAPPADALKTPSGLASKVLKAGKPGFESRHPTLESVVIVEYSAWKIDGELISSTRVSGNPATFNVNDISSQGIKGLGEGIQLMSLGESRRFWIPAELAYGTTPSKGLPAGMLVFDVDLVGIK